MKYLWFETFGTLGKFSNLTTSEKKLDLFIKCIWGGGGAATEDRRMLL